MDFNEARQMIQQNNAWSAQQAQKQMDFQERMSNTAHQREVADLQAAGLNPVLSAKLGGASTPSGAMGDTDTSGTSTLIQIALQAMNTAGSAARAAENYSQIDSKTGAPLNPMSKGVTDAAYNLITKQNVKSAMGSLANSAKGVIRFGLNTLLHGSEKAFEALKNGDKYEKAWAQHAEEMAEFLNDRLDSVPEDDHTVKNWPWSLFFGKRRK